MDLENTSGGKLEALGVNVVSPGPVAVVLWLRGVE
jgi:hypothetical protein